jgi:hypothetical protein
MTCDVVWHKKQPADVIADSMEAWVPNLSIGCLVQSVSMSVNMFGMNMCALPRNKSSTDPVIQSPRLLRQRAELSRECVPSDLVMRIRKLEDSLNVVAERISELTGSYAGLKASCKTADAASQTDPMPTKNCEVSTAVPVTKKDASCDASSDDPEIENVTNEEQTIVPQHTIPKKKRKPRKNRRRGARSRAKAAALAKSTEVLNKVPDEIPNEVLNVAPYIILNNVLVEVPDYSWEPDAVGFSRADTNMEIPECCHFEECATPEPCSKELVPLSNLKKLLDQNDVPETEADAALVLSNADAAALTLSIRGVPVTVAEAEALSKLMGGAPVTATEVIYTSKADLGPAAAAEDRRFIILPAKGHSVGHMLQSGQLNMKNLFQGFHPPLVDPCRLSRWFRVANLDLRLRHI